MRNSFYTFDRSCCAKSNRKRVRTLREQLRLELLDARLPLAFDVSLTGGAVQFDGSLGNDSLTLSVAPGNLLQHNLPRGGNLVSRVDMNSSLPGEQSIALDSISSLQVSGSSGDDFVDASLLSISVVLMGSFGNDVLRGGSGSDVILGGNDDDTLVGNDGDDFLDWNDDLALLGVDILRGGAGNDSLGGNLGDRFFGGLDVDRVIAKNLEDVILTDTTFTNSSFVSVDHGVEDWELRGSLINDTIDASAWTLSDLFIFGDRGNDVLLGGSGNDDIRGGEDNDTLEGNGGNDFLDWNDPGQTAGADIFRGGAGNDSLLGGNLDQFFGGADADRALAFDLNIAFLTDTTFTSSGIVSAAHAVEQWELRGSNRGDFIDASAWTISALVILGLDGPDTLLGGTKDDLINGGEGPDRLVGNDGDDVLDVNEPVVDANTDALFGGAGNDALGGTATDRFFGEAGLDRVIAFNLRDVILTDTIYTSIQTPFNFSIVSENHGVETWELTGTDGPNTIDASAWTISGLVISGLGGDDTLKGGSLSDDIRGGIGDDVLEGNGGEDSLDVFDPFQRLGNDILRGGAGDDFLQGDGFDQFFGGADFDGVFVENLSNAILTNTTFNGGAAVSVNHAIESWFLRGTDNPDTIDASAWTISGLTIYGQGGNDVLRGGSQSDDLYGGPDNDTLEGNGGNDFLDWNSEVLARGNDILRGGPGDDFLGGFDGNDTLEGGANADTLSGGAGDDRYLFDTDTNLGSDTLTERAGEGIDLLGFNGTTTLGVTVGLNTTSLQTVNANLQLSLNSASTFENIAGGQRDDFLTGNGLANLLQGNAGLDVLAGLDGDDNLRGNAGNDTYVFDTDSPLGIDTLQDVEGGIDLLDFSGTTTRSVGIDLSRTTPQVVNANLQLKLGGATQFENVFGGSRGDTLRGNANANLLAGGPGNDRYIFDADSSLGSDTVMESVTGDADTLDFSPTTNFGILLNLGINTPQTLNTNLSLTLSNSNSIENVIGGRQSDTIVGNALVNRIEGRSGDDNLNGASGNDVLLGGSGLDTLVGGPGDDTLKGGADNDIYRFKTDTPMGSDTIEELAVDGIDRLNFDSTTSQSININLGLATAQVINPNLTLTLNAVDTFEQVTGGALDDTLIGNAQSNSLIGGPGNDVLLGLDGNDFLRGGLGNDVLDGGPADDRLEGDAGDDAYRFDLDTPQGGDTLIENIEGGIDLIDFGATASVGIVFELGLSNRQLLAAGSSIALGGNLEFEQLVGTASNDILTGNSLNNVLIGGAGNDTLRGLGGRDLLVGGTGLDTIQGGNGEDLLIGDSLFYYSEASQQLDRAGIDAVMLEWTRTDLPYASRITNLKLGGGLNGTRRVNSTTVATDSTLDQLQGELDLDWFTRSGTDNILDLNTGGTETVN